MSEAMQDAGPVGRRLLISGLVQGVGFRWHMLREAQRLGLSGWVRNLHDGRVEALVVGEPEAVAAMIHWAGHGPTSARVESVQVEESAECAEGFVQRPTAAG